MLVIACDSAGGIGPKPRDRIKTDAQTLGRFTARVALMEVLAVNATPLCIVDTLSVELEPTGLDVLKGIRKEAKDAGLNPELAVTGSSEKNVKVEQTGIGVTVVGYTVSQALKIGVSQPRDVIVAVGMPKVGEEVVLAERLGIVADINTVKILLSIPQIHEIIPVGSEGIAHEARILAECSHLRVKFEEKPRIDMEKSAGPATVLLVSVSKQAAKLLETKCKKPINMVGRLE
jgi:hypothetical protein